MSIIETTHGKLLVMTLGVAMIAAFGGSMAYAQTTQGLSQTLIQGQGFQMNYDNMFSLGHGGIGPIGMCHDGNMSDSQIPGNTIPSSTTGQSQT
ncbi:MAG: hypothetical protein WAN47_09560 [Nitrosotalea sp.]